ncbi:MAG: beta-ketoacyl synthase N-terminal-like domain-containing protein [Planctomycetota bacterium]
MPAYVLASAAIAPEAVVCNGPESIDTSRLSGSSDLHARDYFSKPFPKFGRMDPLARLAVATAELISKASGEFAGLDRSSVAQVGGSMLGCLAADAAYEASRQAGQASPAKFVYTLPSMFQGEIAIRHGLQGRCTMLSAGHSSALQALVTGVRWIEKQRAESVLVVVADAGTQAHSAAWLLAASGEGLNFSDVRTHSADGLKLEKGNWPNGLAYVEALVSPEIYGPVYCEETGYGLSVSMR